MDHRDQEQKHEEHRDREYAEVKRLAQEGGPTAGLLDYAQVVFGLERFDEESAAVAIVTRVAGEHPDDPRAALLFSHSALHIQLDEDAVLRGGELVARIPRESVYRPLAAVHLAAVNEWNGVDRSDRDLTFRLITESVERAPELTSNNAWLGRLHAERGEPAKARRYLERARANILGAPERAALSLVERAWHECFTGRLASPVGIETDLAKLR
ncbi:hypothetical protein [Streptomyces lushanensis]|uniref:hypothetical protein n=1 Tax=Streptomyces lushanensis TaxID=1434255 RepID=UPI0008295C99|nr:hypothetical protein [Streptomyces lushanensis]